MSITGKINHIAMAVPSIEGFLEKHSVFYSRLERGPLIVNETQGVKEMFVSDGNHVLELLEPLREGSPLDGFLKKAPFGGLIHIAYDVEDIATAIAEVERAGGRKISGPVPDVAFDGRDIAFVFLGGQVIELIQLP